MALATKQYLSSGKLPRFFLKYFHQNEKGQLEFPVIDLNGNYNITSENLFPLWYENFRWSNPTDSVYKFQKKN